MNLFIWILIFLGSYLLIYFAADIFLDNLRDLCIIYKLSPFIIGLLVLGIDPEESIASIIAAVNGLPYISIGNVIGNSIISLSLCFSIVALFHKFNISSISQFYFLILYLSICSILFSFFIPFGLLFFGIITLFLYFLYIFKSIRDISIKGKIEIVEIDKIRKSGNYFENDLETTPKFKKIALILISLTFLILGGEGLVISAEGIIELTFISEGFFGFIIIAFVTNVEELTLMFKSIKRRSVEIGLGGMIGKIIWNLSFTYGISALILIRIDFMLILILNWVILLFLILFYQFKTFKKVMGRLDAVILIFFLIAFLIINFLFI